MDDAGAEAAKRRAGERAAEAIEDGDVVGLGTGSTAAAAIRAIGRRVDAGLDVSGIPTSYQARALAREVGIPRTSLADGTPAVAIDGADQVADGDLVKGGGAAHAREKLVDAAADQFVVVVDDGKLADTLDVPVPVEVLPDAVPTVEASVTDLGGNPVLRQATAKDGPVVTDNGNLVLDCDFGSIDAPADLAASLDVLPGVLAHGLFVAMADVVIVGTADGVRERRP